MDTVAAVLDGEEAVAQGQAPIIVAVPVEADASAHAVEEVTTPADQGLDAIGGRVSHRVTEDQSPGAESPTEKSVSPTEKRRRRSEPLEATPSMLRLLRYPVAGGDLSAHLQGLKSKGQRPAVDQCLDWFVQLLLALNYVHGYKARHTDDGSHFFASVFLAHGPLAHGALALPLRPPP